MSMRSWMDERAASRSSGLPTWLLVFASLAVLPVIAVWIGPKLLGPRESPAEHAARLEKAYGIRVEFGAPSTFYTAPYGPEYATGPGYQPQAADPELAGVALEGIENALAVYPAGFVDKLIDAIFVCGMLRLHGTPAGGTVGPAWIILSAPSDMNRASIVLTSELGVHHELSSIVYRHNPITVMRWTAFAPADVSFAAQAGEALVRGNATDPDPSTGFLTAYGASTPENDFNTYAEKLFVDLDTLKAKANQHDLIKRKLKFVLDTYEHIDGRLRKHFDESGLRAATDG